MNVISWGDGSRYLFDWWVVGSYRKPVIITNCLANIMSMAFHSFSNLNPSAVVSRCPAIFRIRLLCKKVATADGIINKTILVRIRIKLIYLHCVCMQAIVNWRSFPYILLNRYLLMHYDSWSKRCQSRKSAAYYSIPLIDNSLVITLELSCRTTIYQSCEQ